MNMDQRRVLLAVALSLGVVLLYNHFVIRPRQQAVEAHRESRTTTTQPRPEPVAPAAPARADYLSFEAGGGTETPVVVDTDVWRLVFTPRGARLTSVALKKFRRSVEPDSPPLELVEPGPLLPLTLSLSGEPQSDVDVEYRVTGAPLTLAGDSTGELVFSGTSKSGLRLEKRVHLRGDSYVLALEVRVSGPEVPERVAVVLPQLERAGLGQNGSSVTEAAVILSQGKIIESHIDRANIASMEPRQAGDARWISFSLPFFAGALIAPTAAGGVASVERVGSRPVVMLAQPLADGAATFDVFLGPKAKEVLADAGFELSRLLDFGWFWFIAIPMLYALRLLHRVTGNYGVDIILLTALVRAATIPLTQKSFRSMRDMQKIQPQLKRLQEQYKDDQARLQKEMMELYKRHGVNPFSGCAPMLLQIPIFVGLYNALLHAIELRHAPFALWITDLSAPERLMIGGIGIPVLTILMGGTMLVQQWLTPQQGDPTQRQLMMIMPVVFTFMFFNFPAGLVLYWLVSNILGIIQQYVMLRPTK
jgi:YidC/Oxa1 family membrane protein insertase